jgi:hypothetical protein
MNDNFKKFFKKIINAMLILIIALCMSTGFFLEYSLSALGYFALFASIIGLFYINK